MIKNSTYLLDRSFLPTPSGSQLVCSTGSTFQVNDLPLGFSTSWNYSTNLVAIDSGTNYIVLRSLSNNTTGWVEASISSDVYNEILPRLNNIYIGTQTPGPITYIMDSPIRRFTAQIDDVPTATSYNWYLGSTLNTLYHITSAIFNRTSPYCGHSYLVKVESINACGTSAQRTKTVIEPSCLLGLSIFPNPASENIEVLMENEPEISDPSFESINEIITPTFREYYVNVTDLYGNRVYSTKIGEKRFNLSVSGFKNGTYIITVSDNKIIWQGTLIVNH